MTNNTYSKLEQHGWTETEQQNEWYNHQTGESFSGTASELLLTIDI